MRTLIVIPARYASSRFPGKPLVELEGKPMVQHVYERAREARLADDVVVATDDIRIFEAVRGFGGTAIMTSPDHPSGTDRLVEVSRLMPADAYVNVQGDEPLIRPADIDAVIQALADDPALGAATLSHPISAREAQDPNAVKVVTAHDGAALYFSRSPIPYPRDGEEGLVYQKHIGLYGYRADVLARYAGLPASPLEQTEKLEQLRLLQAGIRMRVLETTRTGPGVDTPGCLERAKAHMAGQEPGPTLGDLKLLILDVDGVLTDGRLYYTEEGESIKAFHVRDGLGIKLLRKHGVEVAVVSGRDSRALRRRFTEIGIAHFHLAAEDKHSACETLMTELGAEPEQTAFIGDDLPDLAAFRACGFGFAPADAVPAVRAAATHVLATAGGAGAVREAAEQILAARGIAPEAQGLVRETRALS